MRRPERPPLSRSIGRLGPVPAGLMLVLVLVVAGCGGMPRPAVGSVRPPAARPSPIAPRQEEDTGTDAIAQALLDRHNAIRAGRDLEPLALAPKLTEAARVHVAGMIEMGRARHRGVDGSTPAERVERQGYHYVNVAENVAAGQETAEQVMDGWMNSPGHRRNILGDFEQMGAARGEDDDGRPFWCVVFATPLPQLDPEETAAELLARINDRRAEEDLPPLESGEALMGVARDHARAMAEAGSLEPEGFSYIDALNEAGIGYRRVALSVFSGQPRPADVLDALASDPRRRRDLLGDFDRVGIGYATADDGRPYWSLIFLQPPGP